MYVLIEPSRLIYFIIELRGQILVLQLRIGMTKWVKKNFKIMDAEEE